MAGPWFVDPENGLTTNDGLSADTPWQLIPGQTGATAQTGYGVVAGDVINVKNGTTTALRLIPPANNLTYRGYGVASNVLELTLPDPKNPANTVTRRVARQWGSHEGMWTIKGVAGVASSLASNTTSGCTFEDVHVYGNADNTTGAISLATSTQTTSGITLRRVRVTGAPAIGIACYSTGVVMEDIRVEDTDEEAITLGASAANSYRAGTTDVLRRICIINPATDEVNLTGDAFQVFPTSSRYESASIFEDWYIYKPSVSKQALLLTDMLGGMVLRRFHFDGGGTGNVQIGFDLIGGACLFENGYITGSANSNAALRCTLDGIETGASLTVRNVLAVDQKGGLFTWGSAQNATTVNGVVTLENNTVTGENTQGLSFSAALSCHAGANVTLGASAQFVARNNLVVTSSSSGPAVRLPVGGANDVRWIVENNCTTDGTFAIGSTSYATPALFEAAHSAATGNIDGDPLVTESAQPEPDSPLIGAGTHITYSRDLEGKQRPNPPSIGAYDVATLRPVLTSDPA